MNKSLVFQRAWNEHKIKLKHNCPEYEEVSNVYKLKNK